MIFLRIGAREFQPVLRQANLVRGRLMQKDSKLSVLLNLFKTQGDQLLAKSLVQTMDWRLFTQEIERALLDGEVDIALHLMEHRLSPIPDGIVFCGVLVREDPTNALVVADAHRHLLDGACTAGVALLRLPSGACIATSGLLRQSQLRWLRPDLEIVSRDNIDAPLRRLGIDQYDAVVLATGILVDLGFADLLDRNARFFTPTELLPACGQGAIGMECRTGDSMVRQGLTQIADSAATSLVLAERAFALRIGASGQIPLGAHAEMRKSDDGRCELDLYAVVGTANGQTVLRDKLSGPSEGSTRLGCHLAERLLAAGAESLVRPPLQLAP